MNYTLSDAKTQLARFVRGGRCRTDAEVVSGINEAIEILLTEGDWKSTVQRYRVRTYNNHITLPKDVETVLKVNFCTYPRDVWTMAYEFLGGGPGTLDYGNNTMKSDLVDLGDGFPTFYPIEPMAPIKLIALSDKSADAGKIMTIYGLGSQYKNEIVGGLPLTIFAWEGEVEGTINHDQATQNISSEAVQEVHQIKKPTTTGYVTLLGYDLDTHDIMYLGKYHPKETSPGYRRYRITAKNAIQEAAMECLVKIRFMPLINDDDMLQIQNLAAIKMMLIAQKHKDNDDMQNGMIYQADAIRLLDKQLGNAVRNHGELDVRTEGSIDFGSSPNMI